LRSANQRHSSGLMARVSHLPDGWLFPPDGRTGHTAKERSWSVLRGAPPCYGGAKTWPRANWHTPHLCPASPMRGGRKERDGEQTPPNKHVQPRPELPQIKSRTPQNRPPHVHTTSVCGCEDLGCIKGGPCMIMLVGMAFEVMRVWSSFGLWLIHCNRCEHCTFF
jgi:hypothetical protein